ncbi:hypothetical protein [Streptomyces lydicamycinicus]|uniref:hypothetical protein n=1 Tax=Streptomyces lydicamycinicus TaxID=1546107 RepID=UPI003C2F6B86
MSKKPKPLWVQWLIRYWSGRLALPFPVLMLIDFLPMLFLLCVILLIGAYFLGWRITYDVLVLNTPPYDHSVKSAATGWLLWLTGWLVVPAFIGALAGEAVGNVMKRHTNGGTVKQAAQEIREELGITSQTPPQGPGAGGAPGAGS